MKLVFLWDFVQKGIWKISSLLFHPLDLEGLGKQCSDRLTKWSDLPYVSSGQNFREDTLSLFFPAISEGGERGDPHCPSQMLTLKHWLFQNYKKNTAQLYRSWPLKETWKNYLCLILPVTFYVQWDFYFL